MSQAILEPVRQIVVTDEYGNRRQRGIAMETPLTLYLNRREIVTLMTLGTAPEYLAIGYLRNQRLITDPGRITSVQVDWETQAAAISTTDDDELPALNRRTVTSGCGQGTLYGDWQEHVRDIRLSPKQPICQSLIYALLKTLGRFNQVYITAGSVHGCALCDQNADVIHSIEDVGRHNAVDAIAGRMWLEEQDGADKLFYTTGRLTAEMVIKVALMNIPVLISRSGVTQMGLDIAKQTGIVLIARAQGRHFLVYHGTEHVRLDVPLPPKVRGAGTIPPN